MRFKEVTLEKITQVESVISRIQFEISRNATREQVEQSVEFLKSQIEELRSLISIEHDSFNEQFK